MVMDNRIYNETNNDSDQNETDKVPDVNTQIDSIDLEAKAVNNARESGEIYSVTDMREAFSNIREEVPKSYSSAELSELYRQAGALIKLLDTHLFEERAGAEIGEFRKVAEEEFASTAREINRRAIEVGARSRYAEKWGD